MQENSETKDEIRKAVGLLSGIRILSFTQFLLGPAAVQYLGDMGADVVKVESPAGGAWERSWAGAGTFINGISAFFLLSHRNVRSVAIDLKHPRGQEIALRLISHADVLVENFRPGVMDRLGLGYERVHEENQRIVYASGSGWGRDGLYRDLPGQDLLAQCVSGLTTVTGRLADPPTPAGAAVVDQHAASLLAMGIVAALLHRERTGEGQHVEVAMLEAAFDLQLEPLVYSLNGGDVRRPRSGLGSSFHEAPYGIYETQDGHIAISFSSIDSISRALGSPSQLSSFVHRNQSFAEREEVYGALAPLLIARTTKEWIDVLRREDVWCAPVNDYQRAQEDPAVRQLGSLIELDHPIAGSVTVPRHPIRYSSGEFTVHRSPPQLGEHTDEILKEIGYQRDEIDALRASGAI